MADKAPLLTIRGLSVDGEADGVHRAILRDVDLTVRAGEVLGVIGESGAGKSTIGLAATGLLRPGCRRTAGEVRFDGTELLGSAPSAGRRLRGSRIAYVAQSAAASFNPAFRLIDQTIETTLLRGSESRAGAVHRAIGLYRQLLLPQPERIGDRFPHQVSGGQLQRMMIAMALMSSPDLIVFDEPTTALDVTTQIEVLTALRGVVAQRHLAALYITHDLALVSQVAGRILVLQGGKVVEEGETRAMLRAPKEAYTRSLWSVRTVAKPERATVPPILRLGGVTARFGPLTALDAVSLDVARGGIVAVVGESGSGKTTLGRTIAGLVQLADGSIEFDDAPLPSALALRSRETRRRIQLIYQSAETALNPSQKVRRLVGRPLILYGRCGKRDLERRVLDLLRMVELGPHHLDRLPGQLSGGEKQRVAIARALAAEPDLLICDEITSALDQLVQGEILKLVLRLQRELGLTFLFITHDIPTARAIADQVVVMRTGRIVEQGPRSAVLASPAQPYTRLLLASVPTMDADWLTNLLAGRDAGIADAGASGDDAFSARR